MGELVNYFAEDYDPPADGTVSDGGKPAAPFAAHSEVAACPWHADRRLVRIGLKGREIDRAARPPGYVPAAGVASPTWSPMAGAPTDAASSPSQVIPADYQSPVDPRATRFPQPVRGSEMAKDPQLRPLPGAPRVLAAAPMEGRFAAIQDRLRKLGATYYLLESWGSRDYLYRFYCKVAVGGNPDYTHFFEATHSDPLEAMDEVLRQVEAWRAARQ